MLLAYISVNYLLNNVLQPRWDLIVSAKEEETNDQRVMPTPNPIPAFNWDGSGLVTFWFDDAWVTQYDNALPILREAGFEGAIAVPTKLIGFDSYMNWHQVKRAQHLGWEITSHSQVHNCYVDELSETELNNEVIGSLNDLKVNGIRNEIYVLPCGAKNENVIKLITQNYKYLRTVERGLNELPVQNKNAIKIVEVNKDSKLTDVQNALAEARNNKSWVILTFHQISNEDSPYAVTEDFFKEVVQQVELSNLEVVLPTQALSL